MIKRVTSISGLAATMLALAATASADIKLNDNLTLSGYAAGSYEYNRWSDDIPSSDSLFNGQRDTPSADAVKTALTANFKPVTGVISLYYVPNLPTNEITVLDAYVTYDAGNGITITGGKFLSWLGYEAFDTVNMSQITYGAPTAGALLAIPSYHSGLKVEYGEKDWGTGFAVLDSAFSYNGFAKGDGELKHNAGFEGYITYKGVENLTLWGGFAYDTKGDVGYQRFHSASTIDLWAQYQVTKAFQIAAEIAIKDSDQPDSTAPLKGYDWLVFGSYTFNDKWSLIGRVSGEELSSGTKNAFLEEDESPLYSYTQYTLGPSYNVTANLLVRAEYSYYKYSGGPTKNFYGIQALFKF